MSDLEARYRHALATVCDVVAKMQEDTLSLKSCDFLRKVCREAMPDHPAWMQRAKRVSKAKKGITPFMEALDEVEDSGLDEL